MLLSGQVGPIGKVGTGDYIQMAGRGDALYIGPLVIRRGFWNKSNRGFMTIVMSFLSETSS